MMKALLNCKPGRITPQHQASKFYLQVLDLTFCVKSSHAGLLDDGLNFMLGFRRNPLTVVNHTIEIQGAHVSHQRNSPGHETPTAVRIKIDGRIRYRCVSVEKLGPCLQRLMNLFVFEVYGDHGRYCLLHAAVVAKSERGVLICGQSGCGKSSLTLALMFRNGYQYLTDEIACWDAVQGRVVAYPKAIALKAKGYRKFQQPEPPVPMGMWDSKTFFKKLWYVNPSIHVPWKVRKTTRIRHVVFPTYREKGTTRVTGISKTRALVLLHQQRFGANGFGQNDFDTLTGLLRSASAVQVRYHDVFEASDAIHSLMNQRDPT